MKVTGLITEYNPFHNGHLYHMNKAKELTGADYVVVVMSGNFVQRGAPAIFDKYTRVEMALSCGADLVLELPMYYATASAEYFALGAVSVLNNLGCVDSICFGSECGDITVLDEIAEILANEPVTYKEALATRLKAGDSFPTARTTALLSLLNNKKENEADENITDDNDTDKNETDYTKLLNSPNNILGIEYIKALKRLNSSITPVTITRINAHYHSSEINGAISSATAIRGSIHQDKSLADYGHSVPPAVFPQLKEALHHKGPITENDFSSLLYYKLLYQSTEELTNYLDVTEDFANKIKKHLSHFTSYQDLAMKIKSKDITLTRIYRMLLHTLLDIHKSDLDYLTSSPLITPYARVLGLKKEAALLIRKSNKLVQNTMITKVADARQLLDPLTFSLFDKELKATHLYQQMVYHQYQTRLADEYRSGPIII